MRAPQQISGADIPGANIIEWGIAGRALAGERESGDLHVVAPYSDGVLVAAIDGLGHGEEAAIAARAAASVLQANAALEPISLVQMCHAETKRTRGVVLSLASINAGGRTLTWLGVGNVEGMLYRVGSTIPSRESLVTRAGVVGYQLPPLRAATLPLYNGDVLMFATDGISSDFAKRGSLDASADEIAAEVLARCAKETDDALVVVARIIGLR